LEVRVKLQERRDRSMLRCVTPVEGDVQQLADQQFAAVAPRLTVTIGEILRSGEQGPEVAAAVAGVLGRLTLRTPRVVADELEEALLRLGVL
jgi:hypothetical protein